MSDERSKNKDEKLLYCSFCGKSQHEVRKLIAGPSVFICDECVELCNDIIREEIQEKSGTGVASKLPIPYEINEILDEYVIGQMTAFDGKLYFKWAAYSAGPRRHPGRSL